MQLYIIIIIIIIMYDVVVCILVLWEAKLIIIFPTYVIYIADDP